MGKEANSEWEPTKADWEQSQLENALDDVGMLGKQCLRGGWYVDYCDALRIAESAVAAERARVDRLRALAHTIKTDPTWSDVSARYAAGKLLAALDDSAPNTPTPPKP